VTNAQFPECITALEPVTQLYVSIDAATPSTLRAIDRPLFTDFWERFMGAWGKEGGGQGAGRRGRVGARSP
jgi:tRNA wybutosine-synthesizing protein 1